MNCRICLFSLICLGLLQAAVGQGLRCNRCRKLGRLLSKMRKYEWDGDVKKELPMKERLKRCIPRCTRYSNNIKLGKKRCRVLCRRVLKDQTGNKTRREIKRERAVQRFCYQETFCKQRNYPPPNYVIPPEPTPAPAPTLFTLPPAATFEPDPSTVVVNDPSGQEDDF